MKILIDMNMSSEWVEALSKHGYEVFHWSQLGAASAPDTILFKWAQENNAVVFTHDLDFGAILASKKSSNPSVFQIRMRDVDPRNSIDRVLRLLNQFERELLSGALIIVDVKKERVRILPLEI